MDAEEILKGIEEKKRAYLARAISLVEDGLPLGREVVARAFKRKKNAKVLGITGAPGVGKSTLVDGLIRKLRERGGSVGVIAVDPSSPFTGGAILGDRVRIRSRTLDEAVFFRSLATRGHLGGLSRHTAEVIVLMDAFGFDYIVVETVGAGQSEVDVMKYAHSVVVVLAPGLGDDIQAIKAGILEIGDVLCVNKADLPGAERTRRELEMMLGLKEFDGWKPPVLETIASSGEGLDRLLESVLQHQDYLVASGLLEKKVRESHHAVLMEYVKRETLDKIMEKAESDGTLDRILRDLVEGAGDPESGARALVEKYFGTTI